MRVTPTRLEVFKEISTAYKSLVSRAPNRKNPQNQRLPYQQAKGYLNVWKISKTMGFQAFVGLQVYLRNEHAKYQTVLADYKEGLFSQSTLQFGSIGVGFLQNAPFLCLIIIKNWDNIPIKNQKRSTTDVSLFLVLFRKPGSTACSQK